MVPLLYFSSWKNFRFKNSTCLFNKPILAQYPLCVCVCTWLRQNTQKGSRNFFLNKLTQDVSPSRVRSERMSSKAECLAPGIWLQCILVWTLMRILTKCSWTRYLFSSLFFGGFVRTRQKLRWPQKAMVWMNEVSHVQSLEECLLIWYFNLVKRNVE